MKNNLRRGYSKSCGCYIRDYPPNKTHGMSYTRLFKIWAGMIKRCTNKNSYAYKYYGARGICVCEGWVNSFESFRDWSMANGYSDSLSIDRIDVNGNYEPDNCRWTDAITQMNNTRRNRMITYNGVTRSMSEWARETGLSCAEISDRINKLAWNEIDAITTPKMDRRLRFEYGNEMKTLEELHEICGVTTATLRHRLVNKKMSIEEAMWTPVRQPKSGVRAERKKRIVEPGMVFGKLTVLECTGNESGLDLIKCICDCGKETFVLKQNLVYGTSKSCGGAGCVVRKTTRCKVNIGEKYNKLTVIECTGEEKRGDKILCRCDCGREKYIRIEDLVYLKTKSCGCASKDGYERRRKRNAERREVARQCQAV